MFVALLLALPAVACEYLQPRAQHALARVGDQFLYADDLHSLGLDQINNSADSARITQAFIDQWIQEQLIIQQAQQNLSSAALDATKAKVNDYQNSLLSYTYEQQMIANKMDTLITEEQIAAKYEEAPQNLTEPIVRLIYVKTDSIMVKPDSLAMWLNNYPESENDATLSAYCAYNAKQCHLEVEEWQSLRYYSETFNLEKSIQVKDLKIGKAFLVQSKGYKYLCRVLEVKQRGEAPLTYVREKLEKEILRERAQQFIKQLHSQLYETALNNNEIEVYENN